MAEGVSRKGFGCYAQLLPLLLDHGDDWLIRTIAQKKRWWGFADARTAEVLILSWVNFPVMSSLSENGVPFLNYPSVWFRKTSCVGRRIFDVGFAAVAGHSELPPTDRTDQTPPGTYETRFRTRHKNLKNYLRTAITRDNRKVYLHSVPVQI